MAGMEVGGGLLYEVLPVFDGVGAACGVGVGVILDEGTEFLFY